MTDQNTFDYKIAMIGPTQVGKTSLITAILQESQSLLSGTNILMEAGDDKTQTRIKRYKEQLKASLMAGEFNPGAVKSSEAIFYYFLDMRVIRKQKLKQSLPGKTKIRLGILDYPGGWMNPDKFPDKEESREECKAWMHDSEVLIIPIDASMLMESLTKDDFLQALRGLEIVDVATIAQTWAKFRQDQQDPGLLILAPVKCENYFNDNGGLQDRADDLFEVVAQKFYRTVIDNIRQEVNDSSLIKVEYYPVDTIGSVELKKARWIDDEDEIGKKHLDAQYIVRSYTNGEFRPYGADAILQAICKHIIGQEQKEKRGIVASFLRWATGENKAIREALEKISTVSVKSNRKKIID